MRIDFIGRFGLEGSVLPVGSARLGSAVLSGLVWFGCDCTVSLVPENKL